MLNGRVGCLVHECPLPLAQQGHWPEAAEEACNLRHAYILERQRESKARVKCPLILMYLN